jgi:hypothetical protein
MWRRHTRYNLGPQHQLFFNVLYAEKILPIYLQNLKDMMHLNYLVQCEYI